jgi:predicted acetyltransferase
MRDAGCILSGLETPIARWHHRNGWGVASAVTRYQAEPQHLRPIRNMLGGQPVNNPSRTDLEAVYRKAAAERFGFLARSDHAWTHRLEPTAGILRCDHVAWHEPDGGCSGYALYHHRPNGPDEGGIALVVDELIAITPAARLGLLALISEHNNVRQVRWDAPQDFPLPSLVREPRAIEPCWCVDKMLRVVDVSKLAVPTLDTPGADPQGLLIRIEDPQAPWNTGPWLVESASASTFRLTPCRAPTTSTPCVIPATVLGPLLSGYLPVASAIAGGLIDVPASTLIPRLRALFAAPHPPYCPDTW